MINTRPLVTADEDATEDVETSEQSAAVATIVKTEETEEILALSITKPTIRNVAAHTRSCLPGPVSPLSPVLTKPPTAYDLAVKHHNFSSSPGTAKLREISLTALVTMRHLVGRLCKGPLAAG